MVKKMFFLILLIFLVTPCLADSYIIVPPETKFLITEIKCNPIYGTNSCFASISESQKQVLENKGYKLYPNLKVYAFLDQSVPQIKANFLWKINISGENLTGKGQTICILDTGIDYNHSALGGGWGNKVIAGWRFLNDEQNCSSNYTACYDDNGHGTHVAGIIVSINETYKGVAPNSELVIVKVLDSSGSGWLSDIVAGINYCTDYSDVYNISVISMSLGTLQVWDNYCDDAEPILTSAINNATAKNISVIVASGNSGSSGVALPACIENATPVGSVNSYDQISSFSNTWSLKQIFAPGEGIYSTLPNGWGSKSGTSMAAPHVAGAYALINQYLSLRGEARTPQELESLFISTGVATDNNQNHSRVDVYSTYLNLSRTFSVTPRTLDFVLEPGTTQNLSFFINSPTSVNISITFTNLTGYNKTLPNTYLLVWSNGNNATGNETLNLIEVTNVTIYVNLTAPQNLSGIYSGEAIINITGNNITTFYVKINADILYKHWKKLIYSGCETVGNNVEIGNISSFVVKGIFSNSTYSSIIIKNGSEIIAFSNLNSVENKLQLDNPLQGIYEIIFGCGGEGGNISANSNGALSANWIVASSALELSNKEISLNLTPNSTTSGSFNLTTNSTEENVSLTIENFYLIYQWQVQNISNQTYKNFSFIVPYSNNLIINLSWTNSTNNLTLKLTNLRTGETFLNNSGIIPSILELNSSEVKYGFWKVSVFGSNVSNTETFNLTIKFLDNRFKINFTNIIHNFENKIIENNSKINWSFYVSNSTNLINISLNSNATNDINILLYNSTNLVNLTNTDSGNALISTTNITQGYWTIVINNTNLTQSYFYNLTIELIGNNITEIGNITNESHTLIRFDLTSPRSELVSGNYNSVIIVTATENTQYITLNIDLLASTLKLRQKQQKNYYIGNQSLFSGEVETYNTTRNLYLNLNQTKILVFIINNTGALNLTNLSQISSTNLTEGSYSLNFTNIALTKNIFGRGIGYLNITIEPPKNSSYLGTYQGWIYLNSSNGQPFNYLNLTLNVTVINQTLPRLLNNVYYFNNPEIQFKVYFYDNITLDNFWNNSYNLTLKNLTGVIQNISFSYSSGLFSGQINTTNLTEGNYSIFGTINDLANNTAKVNLSFELLHNLNLSIIVPNEDSIVKGYDFIFEVNVSKLGDIVARDVNVSLQLPAAITTDNLTKYTGNISQTNSSLLTWTLKGNNRGTYIINVTAYSFDGKFNKSVSKQVIIKYGDLVIDLYSAPSSKEVNQSFDLSVKVKNNGTWNASNVTVKIEVCDTIKTTDCSKVTISPGNYKICEATSFSCSSTGTKPIYVWFDGVKDATYDEGKVGEIAITSSSSQDSEGGGNQETNYDIYFESIEVDGKKTTTINILQGGKKTLNITVRNIGDVTLNDCYLSISGINSSYYSITPTKKRDMSVGNELSFEIYFSIPDDFKPGNYTLLIKLVSNEYEEGTIIYLKILKVDVKINLTNIEIVQGSQKKIEFYLENIGEVTLHNIKLNLTGISSEYYILSPIKVTSLAENKKTYISLEFNIPKTESIGYKELTFNVISDEKNFSKKINLTVLPSEEEKININNSYYRLIKEFENLTKSIKEAKAQGKNVSSLENRLNEINESLGKLKEYIDQGKYIEAKELINSLSSDIQSLYQNLQVEVKSESLIILVVAIALIIVILSIILLYTFIIPKREPTIKSVYKFKKKNRLHEILNSIRNLFVKIRRRKSTEDIIREKKLKEWQKYYEELKKRKYGKWK